MIRLYFLLPLAIFLLGSATLYACGYGFVGNCSTSIGLRINGTVDSFAIAPCPNITDFNGLHLGVIQSLSLARAKSINWESCQNNVTGVAIYFRVFPTGAPGGTWQMVNLQEDYNTLVGPYTTRYRSVNTNVNLTAGLVVGQEYTMEAYFRAAVDTIGDDLVPETFIVQNNDGLNYHLRFRYGGPTAPPFTVVDTKKVAPNCYGDTTGIVGVSVYGNQAGLFYHWNYVENDNFHTLYNVPAGTYIVTVTGAGGYSKIDTILLGQPPPIANQFINYIPFGCSNPTAQVTAQPTGGVGPYNYYWSNGSSNATIVVNMPGNYTVTVTDVNGCSQNFTHPISGSGPPVFNIQADICSGETYHIGSQSLVEPGTYDIILSGNGGCDTLVHLQLGVLNPAALLANLPTSGLVTCAQPLLSLCAIAPDNAVFSWQRNEATLANTPCILASTAGIYTVTATLGGTANKLCPAESTVVVEEHIVTPTTSLLGQFTVGCVLPTNPILLHALTNAQNAAYLWTYNGAILSTTDSCPFVFAGWTGQGNPVTPTLVVTDAYGCSSEASDATTVVQNGNAPLFLLNKKNLCNGLTEINYELIGGTLPYQLAWSNPDILTNPFTVPAGLYSGTVTDAAGCVSIFSVHVSPYALTTEVQMATGANSANGAASIAVSGGTQPYYFQWSNGNTTPQISDQLPGNYCVTATDGDGCSQDTCITISYLTATEEPHASSIGLAPNPITPGDWLELYLPAWLVGEKVEIAIFDTTGRRWWREDQATNTATLSLLLPAQTPAGLLIVRISSAQGQAIGKCVAQ